MRSCSSCRPPCPPPDSPPASCAFLMQKILGCGRLHLRQRHYTLCLSGLPCQAKPPFSLLAAAVCGTPGFEETPCHERNALRLIVTLPLSLRLRDCDGNIYSAAAAIEEAVTLRLNAPAPKAGADKSSFRARSARSTAAVAAAAAAVAKAAATPVRQR